MFDFQKLTVYQKSKVFNQSVDKLIQDYSFKKNVVDQLGRASWSIVLNIAEGSGRHGNRDRRNFFIISRSSLFEVVAILDLLEDYNQIETSTYNELTSEAEEISKILYTMIKNLES